MVIQLLSLALGLENSARHFSPQLPKDPTTKWCFETQYWGIPLSDWYECYPNPLGSVSWDHWFRIPDSTQVGGCLVYGNMSFPKTGNIFNSRDWYWNHFGIMGPLVPRLDLDSDNDCLKWYGGSRVVFNLKPGDSIRLEYKMTPRDTSVTDTIRGVMMAHYRGIPWTTHALRFARGQRSSASWSRGSILLSRPEEGPIELIDLRGLIIATRAQVDGQSTRVVPSTTPSPGLYQLRWPGGSAGVVIPR